MIRNITVDGEDRDRYLRCMLIHGGRAVVLAAQVRLWPQYGLTRFGRRTAS